MKLLQLVRIIARVLLLLAGTGVAAVGALQFGPRSCAGPVRELPVSGLVKVAAPVAPVIESGRVVRVVDGDTYDVLAEGVRYRVRLLGVDAPEPDQPFGPQAGDSVARLVGPQRLVRLTRRGRAGEVPNTTAPTPRENRPCRQNATRPLRERPGG